MAKTRVRIPLGLLHDTKEDIVHMTSIELGAILLGLGIGCAVLNRILGGDDDLGCLLWFAALALTISGVVTLTSAVPS